MKLIVVLSMIAGALIWFRLQPEPTVAPEEVKSAPGIKYGDLKRRKNDAAREQQLRRERAALANEVSTPALNRQQNSGESVPHVVDIQPNSGSYDTQDVPGKNLPTLDGEMNRFLAEKERFQDLQKERRVEYSQQFIKQAREMGYEVIIDDDMQIQEVRKLPWRRK